MMKMNIRLNKGLLLLLFLALLLLSNCSVQTESGIVGKWHVTHIANIEISDGAYYYMFKSDDTFYRSEFESDLEEPLNLYDVDLDYGTYTLSGARLSCSFDINSGGTDFDAKAYTKNNGNTMIWYVNGVSIKLAEQ
ncbi:MAG: lipocalin family protein [Spirochaetes bacterium]|nr:lipocalin family protein [Spirochaetota bacterium]